MYGVHRLHESRAEIRAFGEFEQFIKAGFFGKEEGAAFFEIGADGSALGHLSGSLIGFDLPAGGVVAVGGVAKEDHAQHRHPVFAGGQFGVGAEIIRASQSFASRCPMSMGLRENEGKEELIQGRLMFLCRFPHFLFDTHL